MTATIGNVNRIDNFSPTASREWLYGRRILYHTITDSARSTIDCAREMLTDSLTTWTSKQRYLAVEDYSSADISFTPQLQQVFKDIRRIRPDVDGFVAIVLPEGYVSQLIRLFDHAHPSIREYGLFYTRGEALDWLLVRLNS
jgi:hypothetical protein